MSDLQAIAVGGKLNYQFDWSSEVSGAVTLDSVTASVPSPLTVTKTDDLGNKKSTLQIAGALHGVTYQVRALGTLSTGEIVPKTLTLRGFNG